MKIFYNNMYFHYDEDEEIENIIYKQKTFNFINYIDENNRIIVKFFGIKSLFLTIRIDIKNSVHYLIELVKMLLDIKNTDIKFYYNKNNILKEIVINNINITNVLRINYINIKNDKKYTNVFDTKILNLKIIFS